MILPVRSGVALALALVFLPAEALAQDNAPPATEKRVLDVSGQGGISWATGNTKAALVSAAIRASLRLGANQVSLSSFYTYSGATTQPSDGPPDAPQQHYVADNNTYARIRYDRSFLGERNAAFVGFLAFRDTSSGWNSRFMPFVGYERVVLQKEHVGELWVEGGYRASYEHLNLDQRAKDEGLPRVRLVHGPTALVGGKLEITPTFELDLGVEAQERLTDWNDLRMNVIASAMSFIGHSVSFGVNFTARYLLTPIGARAHTDTSLQAVIVSQHDFPL